MELPVCRWRGREEPPGRFACSCPFHVVLGDGKVAAHYCITHCRNVDRVPTPAEQENLGLRVPPLWRRLWTFARAWLAHAGNWFRRATRAEHERRLAICRACPHYLPAYVGGRCAKCGCGIAGVVLDKTAWKSATCPIGSW